MRASLLGLLKALALVPSKTEGDTLCEKWTYGLQAQALHRICLEAGLGYMQSLDAMTTALGVGITVSLAARGIHCVMVCEPGLGHPTVEINLLPVGLKGKLMYRA